MDLGSSSSCLASTCAFLGNKVARAVAGESARARKPEMQSVSNVPCQLGTCQLGYECKEQNLGVLQYEGVAIHFKKQNRLLTGHERNK